MNKFFQYIRTDIFRKNLIIAIISFIVFLIIVFFLLRSYTRHGQLVDVPTIKGMVINDAIRALNNQGFEYQIDSVYQADKQPGLVIDQNPVEGSKVKENRTIYLTIVTLSAPEVKFPEVRELTFLEARSIIQNYGLKILDTIYIPDIARDRVLDVKIGNQKLLAGQEIAKGSEITLILGNGQGDAEVDIPNVVGLTLSEATFSILGSSLTIGTVRYMGYITDSLSARVISQTPQPDSLHMEKVSIGTPVNLALSN
jgi:beta-lactam-binding protein with PASTA domain